MTRPLVVEPEAAAELEEEIAVTAVFHHRRDPARWQSRR